MNTIAKVNFPNHSILHNNQYHYTDSYKGSLLDVNNEVNLTTVGKAFFSSSPAWADKLFEFRNWLVSFIGLKTNGTVDNKEELLNNFKGEKGERVGLFKVFDKTDEELILGEDDKHLDFRISLMVEEVAGQRKEITISTTVIFHNWMGKLYFLPVKPFHKLIVPRMLKGIIKQLEQK